MNKKYMVFGIIAILASVFTVMATSLTAPQPPPRIRLLSPNNGTYLSIYSVGLGNLASPLSNQTYVNQKIVVNASVVIPSANVTQPYTPGANLAVLTQCASYVYQNSTKSFVYQSPIVNQTTTTYANMFNYTPTATGIYVIGATCLETYTTWNPGTNSWLPWTAPFTAASSTRAVLVVSTPLSAPPSPAPITVTNFFNTIGNILLSAYSSIVSFLRGIGLIH